MQSTFSRIVPRLAGFGDARQPQWLALATIVALGACAATPRPVFAPRDDAAVRAVLTAQQVAWNRGDLAGYMGGYVQSESLVFTSGGNIRRGWAETFAKYKAKYGSDPSTMGTLAFEILGVQSLGADGAIVLGRWTLTNTPVAGSGIFSVALERTQAGWLVVHDHTSSDSTSASEGRRGDGDAVHRAVGRRQRWHRGPVAHVLRSDR